MKRQLAGITLVAFVAHVLALRAGFVWLDHAHLEGGAAIAQPHAWLGLFRHGFAGTGFYRPLMALSLSIDAWLASSSGVGGAFVFHVTSVAWHALAVVLVVPAAKTLGLSRRAATLAAVIFAVHPATGLVANAIAFRSEAMVLVGLLVLVTAHAHRRPVLAAAALALAALSKETGLVLAPLFVVGLEITLRRDRIIVTPGPAAEIELLNRRRRWVYAGELVVLAGVLVLRHAFAPSFRATYPAMTVSEAIGTRLATVAKGVLLVVLPVDGTISDVFVVKQPWDPSALAGLFVLGVVAVLAWRRRGPALLLALAMLPLLQIVPVMRWWSPHYVYLALPFATMLFAEAMFRRGNPVRAKRMAYGLAAAFATLSIWDASFYASDAALFGREIAQHPTAREASFYLGEVDREAGRWNDAEARYAAALASTKGVLAYVDRRAALQNLGIVRAEQGRYADAKSAFCDALAGTTDEGAARELAHDLEVAALRARAANRWIHPRCAAREQN